MPSGHLGGPQTTMDNHQVRSIQVGLSLLPVNVTYRTAHRIEEPGTSNSSDSQLELHTRITWAAFKSPFPQVWTGMIKPEWPGHQ